MTRSEGNGKQRRYMRHNSNSCTVYLEKKKKKKKKIEEKAGM